MVRYRCARQIIFLAEGKGSGGEERTMDDLAGVAGVPLVMGLVEATKRLGLSSRWAPTLAVGLGLTLSLGYHAALGLPAGEAWAQAAVNGLALGLAAAGLYRGARTLADGRPRTTDSRRQPSFPDR
jgi:hypothetical protein